ncbi:MAG: hypothetical protein CMD15_01540 [Flavobacteriales bacterium]|jgi:hypothetical protein|nr:hypothetical protein [Flavobacteriales bacterium]|tara:strand:+ start:70343 stop:70633 length:291 start_codon:yes stop_codon:yes gene_type:complete
MRGKNNQKIGEIIKKLTAKSNIKDKLDKLDILDYWHDTIGKNLTKYIVNEYIKNDVLYVKLKSSVVRNELSYNKSKIIEKVNSIAGKKVIKDIFLK